MGHGWDGGGVGSPIGVSPLFSRGFSLTNRPNRTILGSGLKLISNTKSHCSNDSVQGEACPPRERVRERGICACGSRRPLEWGRERVRQSTAEPRSCHGSPRHCRGLRSRYPLQWGQDSIPTNTGRTRGAKDVGILRDAAVLCLFMRPPGPVVTRRFRLSWGFIAPGESESSDLPSRFLARCYSSILGCQPVGIFSRVALLSLPCRPRRGGTFPSQKTVTPPTHRNSLGRFGFDSATA